jgi:hypothetical protein
MWNRVMNPLPMNPIPNRFVIRRSGAAPWWRDEANYIAARKL